MNINLDSTKLQSWVIPFALSSGSLAVGVAIGFYIGKSQTSEVIHVRNKLNDESDVEDKPKVGTRLIENETEMDEEPVEDNTEVDEEPVEDETEVDEEPIEDETEMENIFSDSLASGWNYDTEIASRSPDAPYVIHRDEFFDDDTGMSQTTLMYYAGDDILTDSEDTPIYGYEGIVGTLQFGHGSDDANTFYVRNDKLKAEYEILRDPGFFSEIILGLIADEEIESELRHSQNRLHKFRMDD